MVVFHTHSGHGKSVYDQSISSRDFLSFLLPLRLLNIKASSNGFYFFSFQDSIKLFLFSYSYSYYHIHLFSLVFPFPFGLISSNCDEISVVLSLPLRKPRGSQYRVLL